MIYTQFKGARIQPTKEALSLIHPNYSQHQHLRANTLKRAGCSGLITGKRNFRNLRVQLIDDLAIDNLAHLKILLDRQSALVTSPIHLPWHQRATGVIRLTHITIYPGPAVLALTSLLIGRPDVSIVTVCQGITD